MDLFTTRAALDTIIQANITPAMRGYPAMPKKPQVPCYVIFPETIAYNTDYDGDCSPQMIVQLLAGPVDSEAAQRTMDAWVSNAGTASMVVAIQKAPWAQVLRMQRYGTLTRPDGTEFLSSQLVVSILGDATTSAVAP